MRLYYNLGTSCSDLSVVKMQRGGNNKLRHPELEYVILNLFQDLII